MDSMNSGESPCERHAESQRPAATNTGEDRHEMSVLQDHTATSRTLRGMGLWKNPYGHCNNVWTSDMGW
ncbi:hypothetical protein TNCV_2049461 [Trichonephila clavipes]|nr:hypothetical protein TNCV_2049461 [Trichonephila clavipes]